MCFYRPSLYITGNIVYLFIYSFIHSFLLSSATAFSKLLACIMYYLGSVVDNQVRGTDHVLKVVTGWLQTKMCKHAYKNFQSSAIIITHRESASVPTKCTGAGDCVIIKYSVTIVGFIWRKPVPTYAICIRI